MSTQVNVDHTMINAVHSLYINPTHHVFDLVPLPLNHSFAHCYESLGRPSIQRDSIWDIYLDMLRAIRQYADLPELLSSINSDNANDSAERFEYIEGQQDLPNNGHAYLGGVANGRGLRMYISAVIYSLVMLISQSPDITWNWID